MAIALLLIVLLVNQVSCQIPLSNLLNIFNIVNKWQFDTPSAQARVSDEDVKFYLHTQDGVQEGKELKDFNLNELDPKKETKYIIHGWTESAERQWYKDMTKAYLSKGDYNIICVDWSGPASNQYPISARNTRFVGEIVGRQIAKLHLERGLPLDNVHILGHSLGGHVSGFAGKEVIELTGEKISRITGLDPAGPLFEVPFITKQNRLSDEDAKMVDIIHTDGGVFGFKSALGTVDFYPNGGVGLQPGCNLSDLIGILGGSVESVFCSHMRSHKYFTEAILSDRCFATGCISYDFYQRGVCKSDDKIIFGDACPSNSTGVYYFTTSSQFPFLQLQS